MITGQRLHISRRVWFPVVVLFLVASAFPAFFACTSDDSPASRLKTERRQLKTDLRETIEAIEERLAALEARTDANGAADDTISVSDTETDRLRQIRSALAYRLHQVDSIPDPMWRDFRTDAERLINDARRSISEPASP